MPSSPPITNIPKGSWVLVTGATGFLASHIVKQFLERGYRVRGTVRNLSKASWLTGGLFKHYAESGYLDLTLVSDLAIGHAFDEAVKGVSAIVHVAAITTFNPDPNKVIPQSVAGVNSILEAAMRESATKEFVLTSSFLAAAMAVPGNDTHIDKNSWNDTALKLAWAPPPFEPARGGIVNMASKAEAEKALWQFAEDEKPHFNVNVISPATILGEPLNRSHIETEYAWTKKLYDGDTSRLSLMPALITINVRDVAALHVAAILDGEVKSTRIQAWGQYCNWNDVLAIMRRLHPKYQFVGDLPNMTRLSLSTDLEKPLALLEKWTNQKGWSSLEETVAEALGPVGRGVRE